MAWVEFKAGFEWTPPGERRVTTEYHAGNVVSVPRACADAAVAAGKAREIEAPSKLMAEAIAAAGNRWPRNAPVEAPAEEAVKGFQPYDPRADETSPLGGPAIDVSRPAKRSRRKP